MKSPLITDELAKVAQRVIWVESSEEAVADPVQLVAYAMTYGTHEDMKVIRRYFSDDELREYLAQARSGIFDARSWAYWHLKLDRYPPPPLPTRVFR
ncbi:MAG: hypothetical protein MRJ96_03085 [Nitrospirales bacterium]|nr:hypothetical protein [Nitrospira sp.]MDR4500422.1 hypothetical protein [Nitrospirales bacterium]